MKYMICKAIRRACHAGVLGFYYPTDFSIRTCLQWRMYRHERATVDYLKRYLRPGNVFIDIGAHIGYYAAYVAKLVGPKGVVYAFEPHPSNCALLMHNCRGLPQVRTIQAAVSDLGGEALLFEHSKSSSSHALIDISGSQKTVAVHKVSLDEWIYENKINKVDVILVDVEGNELSVLRGMQHIIRENANILIILEYCPSNWISQRETIHSLINEIYKLNLCINCALGQIREYEVPLSISVEFLKSKLAGILEQEMSIEKIDYVNIVLRKQE